MKKSLALFVVLCLALSPVAMADTAFDLQSMSIDDLVALRAAINSELLARGFEKEVTVPAGTYTIGEDIPAGSYTISNASRSAVVTVRDANGRIADSNSVRDGEIIGKITLTNGQTIEIYGGNVIFAPYRGLGF